MPGDRLDLNLGYPSESNLERWQVAYPTPFLDDVTEEAAELTPQDTSRRLQPETVVRELGSLSETLNSALDRLGAEARKRLVAPEDPARGVTGFYLQPREI